MWGVNLKKGSEKIFRRFFDLRANDNFYATCNRQKQRKIDACAFIWWFPWKLAKGLFWNCTSMDLLHFVAASLLREMEIAFYKC